eukprot:gb/GECH01009964.1/.p1 GENE.gb/GECH01009964.1/~~gb/GECH01009964.1/.p1  ORF type:complete len:194 (+),score=28.80 gb/GECH01009964.1/:1-582(+)
MARNGTADVMDISDVPQDEDANSGEGSHRPVFTDNEEEDSALEEERYLRGWATGLEGASGAMVDGDEELFKGHMRKEGEVFKTWRRRFFVLRRNTGLAYYKTEEAFCEDMPPIRTVPVKDALVVPAPERDQPYCFKVRSFLLLFLVCYFFFFHLLCSISDYSLTLTLSFHGLLIDYDQEKDVFLILCCEEGSS